MGDNRQELSFGPIQRSKVSGNDTLYYISGKKMYEIGEVSGKYPPIGWRRPGFLAGKRISEVGPEDPRRPQAAAHLLREMGGIWAHPMKAIESLYFSITVDGERWTLCDSDKFVYHFSSAEFHFQRDGLTVIRTDFIHEDEPILFINLQLINHRPAPLGIVLAADVEFNLMPGWFSGWPNGDDIVEYESGILVAHDYDPYLPYRWAVAFACDRPADRYLSQSRENPKVPGEHVNYHTLEYEFTIPAHGEMEVPFIVSAENQNGAPVARERLLHFIGNSRDARESKTAAYEEAALEGVQLECTDGWFCEAFQIAKANLLILMCDLRPFVGPYLFAGIPEYVQLFGTDTAYSIPGMVSAGFHQAAADALSQLALKAKTLCGRCPHEVTTNGRIFHPGNTQETSQFAIACWNYFRWSGDRQFLEWIYPLCQEGVLDYSPAHWDIDLDYYLDGNSMVERPGMGDEKLDSVCYFCAAITVMANMADVLGWTAERDRWRDLAETLKSAINEDWWIESESLFADSLEEDHTHKLDGHWIIAIPMESNVAERSKGIRALQRIERDWVNEWGLVHTREREDLVWTLCNGVLAIAEFNYGNAEMGTWLLRQIAVTMEHDALGTFKELIPQGLSFVQLWSPAMFLQGVVEGIFRLDPRAHAHFLAVRRPRLSTDWTYATLKQIVIGEHRATVDLRDCRNGVPRRIKVLHESGPADLTIECELLIDRQDLPVHVSNDHIIRQTYEEAEGERIIRLSFVLEAGQQADIVLGDTDVRIGFAASRTAARSSKRKK